jgi:putative hydrolase
VIRNDLHVHSVQSFCGFHTVLEIAQIAIRKGVKLVNVSDHGSGLGKLMNFGVITDKRRLPNPVTLPDGSSITILRGIEANIMDVDGNTDIPEKFVPRFDLISIGFHYCGLPEHGSEADNTRALVNVIKRYPIDLITHPCISTYPLDMPTIIELSKEYGFALEINNTNLRVEKTNVDKLKQMIELAIDQGVTLVETSDGHTYTEIGENEKVEQLLNEMGLNGGDFLVNRDDDKLQSFLDSRIKLRV